MHEIENKLKSQLNFMLQCEYKKNIWVVLSVRVWNIYLAYHIHV